MQFDRKMQVAISNGKETKVYDERLNISLRIAKSIENNEPDTCEVEIFNLAEISRGFIGDAKLISIKLGYPDNFSTVFLGDIRNVSHAHVGTEWVTSIGSGDKAASLQTATMNKTYIGGTRLENPLKDIATSFGTELELIGDSKYKDSALPRAKSYTLDTKTHMNQIAKEHDLDWAIQDGVLVIAKKEAHRESKPYLLSYTTGLLNSPQAEYDDKTKKVRLRAVCLMNPKFRPGDTVVVESSVVSGTVGNTKIAPREGNRVAVNIKNIVFNANSREGEFTTAIDGIIM